jgi:acetate kinase
VKLDEEKNSLRGEQVMITTPDSKTKVCVVPTNEELTIARETVALL